MRFKLTIVCALKWRDDRGGRIVTTRKVKIVATLGPASSSEENIGHLIRAGVNVFRLNFSHGDHDMHRDTYARVRKVAAHLARPVAILQDLQGPKIRCGHFIDGKTHLKAGDQVRITTETIEGDHLRFSTGYKELVQDVEVGHRVLLDDGKLMLRVAGKEGGDAICDIVYGGPLSNNKGINLPDTKVSVPALTPKDIEDAILGQDLGVDGMALSFVRSRQDIRLLRRVLAEHGEHRPVIIAKIEKPQAVEQLSGIMEEADGVMVARGDLGVEMQPEDVPIVQKRIVEEANHRGKIVIVATQMLESMIENARPTRAEASDVANAVLDGTDCVMLSGETAVGAHPMEVVKTMAKIIEAVEASDRLDYRRTRKKLAIGATRDFQNAISLTAVRAAEALTASCIVVYSASGATARLIAEYRPRERIVALVPSEEIRRKLSFAWGIESVVINSPESSDDLFRAIDEELISRSIARPGDTVVVCTKSPFSQTQRTNTLHLYSPGVQGRGTLVPSLA